MHNGFRQMLQVGDDHWVIRCRICAQPRKMHFTTARECHDWWRSHEATGRHLAGVAREPERKASRSEKAKMAAMMREIFGTLPHGRLNTE